MLILSDRYILKWSNKKNVTQIMTRQQLTMFIISIKLNKSHGRRQKNILQEAQY